MKIWQILMSWIQPGRRYSDRWLERETARLLAEAALPARPLLRWPATTGRRLKAH